MRMFADDTKIFAYVDIPDANEKLQRDFALQDWSDQWQLRFNVSKCTTMHLGRNNRQFKYYMKDSNLNVELEETVCESDLGVHMDPALKFPLHCEKAVSKANKLLGMKRRSFDYLDKQSLAYLYKGLIRPNLEYENTIWSPQLKKKEDKTLL